MPKSIKDYDKEAESYAAQLAALKAPTYNPNSEAAQAAAAAKDKLLNREAFNYDVSGDALYQQYKDRFINQGNLAMKDTLGKATALTGGYNNSYAQNAGQQAYQQYMTGLTDKIPELYSMAYSKYENEGNDLRNNYNMLQNRADEEYARYQDDVSRYNADRNYLTGQRDTARELALKLQDNEDARQEALGYVRDTNGNYVYAPKTVNNAGDKDATLADDKYNAFVDDIASYVEAGQQSTAKDKLITAKGITPAEKADIAGTYFDTGTFKSALNSISGLTPYEKAEAACKHLSAGELKAYIGGINLDPDEFAELDRKYHIAALFDNDTPSDEYPLQFGASREDLWLEQKAARNKAR